jgi:hypothetical protein
MKLLSHIIALALPDAKPIQVAAALAIIPLYIKAAASLLKEQRKRAISQQEENLNMPCYLKLC